MDSAKTIYVENFPLDTEENHLSRVFSGFGKIKHIHVPTLSPEDSLNRGHPRARNKGYAFIEYYSPPDATKACEFFHDLRNILDQPNQAHERPSGETRARDSGDDHELAGQELKRLQCVRVMMKQKFQTLSKDYDDQRFQSLIKVAKQLVV